jgi:hypothetical protein
MSSLKQGIQPFLRRFRSGPTSADSERWERLLPQPLASFRQRSWRAFQQTLDPLALPRPLPHTPAQTRPTGAGHPSRRLFRWRRTNTD